MRRSGNTTCSYIEMGYPEDPVAADEDLHVSASNTDDGCTSTWGKKFDPDTAVDPIVVRVA